MGGPFRSTSPSANCESVGLSLGSRSGASRQRSLAWAKHALVTNSFERKVIAARHTCRT